MNLHDLLDKGNKRLQATGPVRPERGTLGGDLALGVVFPKQARCAIEIPGASEFPHIAAGVDDIGWSATLLGPGEGAISVSFRSVGDRAIRRAAVTGSGFAQVFLPSLLDLENPFARADLIVEVDNPPSDLFLATSRRVKRDPLYRLARGVGVEIGPGPRPQIHNGPGVEVSYVEEAGPEQWAALYKSDISRDAWEKDGYRIGKAHDLPVADASLDFIFSSHVLEHLFNPLGHLEHWKRKLKPGGVILAVVPAVDGTKDFVLPPTDITELIEEHAAGGFALRAQHYERWVRAQQPHHKDPRAVALKYEAERFSIHVHVWDYMTINLFLRHAVAALDFTRYRVHYRKNSKDFIFALKA
ncbi:methyltransferase domain-containing protein [Rheinheimera sp.]|uniref:methyltransferase domain-containing protein n=1 Tax=Rheinheimera sp. TaxID=1869214 RepID=UPI003AF71B3F